MHAQDALTRTQYELDLDAAIAGSFPASDPLPSTLGASSWMEVEAPISRRPLPAASDVIVRDGTRLGGIRVASLIEAAALAAMLPFVILIAGLPIVALVRGLAGAITWLIGG